MSEASTLKKRPFGIACATTAVSLQAWILCYGLLALFSPLQGLASAQVFDVRTNPGTRSAPHSTFLNREKTSEPASKYQGAPVIYITEDVPTPAKLKAD